MSTQDHDRECIVFKTAQGWAGAAVTHRGVCRIVLPCRSRKQVDLQLRCTESGLRGPVKTGKTTAFRTAQLLKQYFSGAHVSFDLPLDLRYTTHFQLDVWKAAQAIPYGETRSYAWIARRVRKPRAARAVGQALGANPVPIIIP